ncbi:acyltransferase [Parahaliea sp. F7430]|uniref:Acyltransferase n=1 Tax=Sediminihaliea albiluteola TaxID=2758564 RepID=A0A7W2YIX0_9GAMM|nr:acyltransferase family protein [Sediminihaliea albiluteola]MBA6412941.1 acyltransferase [Sediminihaliea albiluteola]
MKSKTATSTPPYFSDIQGLRAVAITIVVLAHAGIPKLQGGFVGVDVFFVLSGYLITQLLLRELEQTGKISLLNFYARRFKRLLPALIAMLIATLVASKLLLSNSDVLSLTRSFIFASSWTSNLFFAFRNINYFNELESLDIYLHTWSLGVEEQFYIFWPLFLLVLYTILKHTKIRSPLNYLLFSFSLVGLISWTLSNYWMQTNPIWAYYLTPSRIWQFSLGASLVPISRLLDKKQASQSLRNTALYLGLLFIVLATLIIDTNKPYPGLWALIPSLGAALILAFITKNQHSLLLSNPVFIWLGDRSYSWYLWHWPIFVIAKAHNALQGPTGTLVLIAISIGLASISYKVVEKPFWKGQLSHFSTGRVLAGSVIVILISINFGLFSLKGEQSTDLNELAGQLTISRSDVPIIYRYQCDLWYHSDELTPCEFKGEGYSKTIVLIGDSILAQWFSLFAEVYPPPEWRVIVLTKSACPMIDVDFFYPRIGATYTVCSNWRQKAIEYLKDISPDLIVLGSAASNSFNKNQWIDGSRRIFEKLTLASDNIVVIAGTPKLAFDGPSCLERALSANNSLPTVENLIGACQTKKSDSPASTVEKYLDTAIANIKGVSLINLNALVCPNNICGAISKDGVIVFRDSQHLTDSFVRSLIPEARIRLKEIVM